MPWRATTNMHQTHVLIQNVSRYWIEIKFHYVIISWFRKIVLYKITMYTTVYSIWQHRAAFDRSKSMWYNGLMIWINLLTNQSRLYCTDTNEFFYQRCHRVSLIYIHSPCLPKAFQKCFISLATCVIIIHLRSLSFVLQSLCKKCLTWYFHFEPIMSHYEWYQLF